MEEHDVPILSTGYKESTNDWDMATTQLLPYIDGFRHVAKIAADSDVDVNIVKVCVQNLVYYDVVKIISIFQVLLRARLHQVSASTLWQLSDDAKDSVAPDWGLKPILKQLHCFQWEQNSERHCRVDADIWCKPALKFVDPETLAIRISFSIS